MCYLYISSLRDDSESKRRQGYNTVVPDPWCVARSAKQISCVAKIDDHSCALCSPTLCFLLHGLLLLIQECFDLRSFVTGLSAHADVGLTTQDGRFHHGFRPV
jgi:hypothetical protein